MGKINGHTRVGELGIIAMRGSEGLARKAESWICEWRKGEYWGDDCPGFSLPVKLVRFSTGEGKALLDHTTRGHDVYIICDVFNYGVTYKMYGMDVPMSPDDHYQDLKRVIGSIGGKARRITVIMPMLYEGRQDNRTYRESLDCAIALQELTAMGVDNIIAFDAHNARVQNAIPLSGFDNVRPTYQMIKALLNTVDDIELHRDKCVVISPDEGGMTRSMYFSSALSLNLGMFYKRRDYSRIVNGRNPIIAHEFLGSDIAGKDALVIDDIMASGDSMLQVAEKLKAEGAQRVFMFSTFGQFTSGFDAFDRAYQDGFLDKVFTTNLIYQRPELLEKPWYRSVDMSKFIAYIIDTLNADNSISSLLEPTQRIEKILRERQPQYFK
ncbi:MAG: ribose-phosphate pyrophosphokinase [Oscillospiraceae bacterium]|nr:ribose-phosphate pyrophosphokinase [Oscillospiraceae bacterium]